MTSVQDGNDIYSEELVRTAENTEYYGRSNDPTTAAYVKGPCGDEMEFYLVIRDGRVEGIKFFTTGCLPTKACASVAASMALGNSIEEVLKISPGIVMDSVKELPRDHRHCAILAVSTLHKAIACYFLKD